MDKTLQTICLLAIFVFCIFGDILKNPEVILLQGQLRGTIWKTKNGREFSAFLGIPYAEPPVGELRFKAPVAAKPWDGVFEATEPHGVCPQRDVFNKSELIEGEEDCLYLNVYTPKVPKDSSTLYPVLVFIHGGGWLCGTGSSFFYSPGILLDNDVVLVVPNYRLGALGLLSTGDEIAPGNNALKDQNLALRWVKENIQHFGGDSNKVMIFGESAGGASTHFHVLSPMSQGLFHAAISQSGTALAPWALASAEENAKQSKKLAKALNCPITSSQGMLDCLRTIPAHKIVAQDKIFMEWDIDPLIPFRPVIEPNIEGAFLTEYPIEIIKAGKSGNIPWMTGVNSEDGALRAAGVFGNSSLILDLDQQFNKIAPISLLYNYDGIDKDVISKKIREFYFQNKRVDDRTRCNAVDMYTDALFLTSADDAVALHRKYSNNSVFYYLFAHHGVGSLTVHFGDPVNRYGVCHADELQYLFPFGDMFPNKVEDALDKRMVELISSLWINFARFGNPTPEVNAMINTKWYPVEDVNDKEYFIIGGGVHRGKGLLEERARFWRTLPIHTKRTFRDEL